MVFCRIFFNKCCLGHIDSIKSDGIRQYIFNFYWIAYSLDDLREKTIFCYCLIGHIHVQGESGGKSWGSWSSHIPDSSTIGLSDVNFLKYVDGAGLGQNGGISKIEYFLFSLSNVILCLCNSWTTLLPSMKGTPARINKLRLAHTKPSKSKVWPLLSKVVDTSPRTSNSVTPSAFLALWVVGLIKVLIFWLQ